MENVSQLFVPSILVVQKICSNHHPELRDAGSVESCTRGRVTDNLSLRGPCRIIREPKNCVEFSGTELGLLIPHSAQQRAEPRVLVQSDGPSVVNEKREK